MTPPPLLAVVRAIQLHLEYAVRVARSRFQMGVPVPLPKKTAVHILPKAANMIRSQKCRLLIVRLVGYSSPESALLCTRHSRRHGAVILQQLHVNAIHESTTRFRGSRSGDVREDGDRPCCCGHRTRKPGPHRLLSKQSARGLVNARVDITAHAGDQTAIRLT